MTDDVVLPVIRVQKYDLRTVANSGETLQLVRFHAPEGPTPWLALTPELFSDLLADMPARQHAALDVLT